MKISTLQIEGFRSLYEVDWKPGDLNVVIGPNGSGKSNLLKVLELLSASARGRLGRQIQREGGMEPVVWDGRISQVTFKLRTSPLDPARDSLTYELTLARLGMSSAYYIKHELLGNDEGVAAGEKPEPLKLVERTPQQALVYDEEGRRLTAPVESVPEEETLLSLAAGPFTANRWITAYQNRLAGWRIYHDFQTHAESPVRQPSLARHETAVEADGSNLVAVLHTLYTGSREFKQDLNSALMAAFGEDFEELLFPPAADQRIQMRVRWRSLKREQTTADLSDGTLRFLFLIAILANPNPPALIAIDEPETGLHPAMLPIVAEYAAEAALHTQVIFTTHSAEFLDAFHGVTPVTTIVKWEEGKTQLQVVDAATLNYWLKEYTLGKLFRSGNLEGLA